jgi:hypothetical protein
MTRNWIIAFTLGTITTSVAFVGGIWLLISRSDLTGGKLLFYVSVAIAPLAMVAVMVGFGVWWMIMFLLTLFASERNESKDG